MVSRHTAGWGLAPHWESKALPMGWLTRLRQTPSVSVWSDLGCISADNTVPQPFLKSGLERISGLSQQQSPLGGCCLPVTHGEQLGLVRLSAKERESSAKAGHFFPSISSKSLILHHPGDAFLRG